MPNEGETVSHSVSTDVLQSAHENGKHTFSIALLVRPSLDPLLSLFALGVDALLCYAILDAAKAGTGVVALLARLLAVGAGVLDLTALGAGGVGRDHAGREGVHVHGHARVGDGMHGHLRLNGVGGGLRGLLLRVGLGVRITHGGEREGETKGRRRMGSIERLRLGGTYISYELG